MTRLGRNLLSLVAVSAFLWAVIVMAAVLS